MVDPAGETQIERTETVRVSVVVPCYNEEGAVVETLGELEEVLAGVGGFEIVAVDDGSTDRTGERLAEIASGAAAVRVVRHAENQGYGAALKTGVRHSNADLVAIIDADGTYPVDRLPELVEAAEAADMVVGARVGEKVSYPAVRRIPKLFLTAYARWVAGQPIPDINSGLRVFRRSIAERFLKILPDGFSFTLTITLAMLRNRHRVVFLPIDYAPRVGASKIQPVRDTLRFFQLILRTGMYFAPLRILSPLVVVLSGGFLASLVYDVWVLRDLTDKTVLLLLFAMNTGLFALLADMIDKRSP